MKTILLLALSMFVVSSFAYADTNSAAPLKVSSLVFDGGKVKIINAAAEDGPCSVTRTYIEHYKCSNTLSKTSTCSVWTDMKGNECRVTCESHTCPAGQ